MSKTYRPMLAQTREEPFNDKNWLFEVKWDGFRAIAYLNEEEISLKSRNGNELIPNFPELKEISKSAENVVLDGEIVILQGGKVDFQALLERSRKGLPLEIFRRASKSPAIYVVFDILEKDGKPLLDLPLIERKKILKSSVKEGDYLLIEDYIEDKGEAYFEAALEKGLEGIIAKKKDSIYEPGNRSSNWLKIKKLRTCDCVIFGYTKGSGSRQKTFGSLILGLYKKEGKPTFVGKVGTGFSHRMLQSLYEEFQELRIEKAPFETDSNEEIIWLKPDLVAEIVYQVVTKDFRLRMPRFQRIRSDKKPAECTIDQIMNKDSLQKYRSKRNFSLTREPRGEEEKNQDENIFVVQEHHSRRLHYDFRLEKEGVLKSWTIPKGIPETIDEKRLAVETEDHPIEYAKFEGEIPKGEYGAGTVKISDKGTYKTKVWDEKMIEFYLQGEKLKGRYVLVRLKRGGDNNWLMLKAKD